MMAEEIANEKVSLKKFSPTGEEVSHVEVSSEVFGIEPNIHVLHLALRRELANARAGTACAKTRSEVRGGGKKPWKQKGTGRARAGSIRSPLWVGGGVIFGPKPRDYSFSLPRKVRALALRSSLSSSKDKIKVVEDFSFLKAPKTKDLASFVDKLGLKNQKVLILADYKCAENQHIYLSVRNLPDVKLCLPHNLSVKELLNAQAIVMSANALQEINERYVSYV